MTNESIPPDVREFLVECIDSVAQLEALLLLRGSPQREWYIQDIAGRLFISQDEAGHILSALLVCELAKTDGVTFRYSCSDAEHRQLIDRVAQVYSRYLVPVTTLIHDKSKSILRFAEAFKFRKNN